jgi:membrane peptidoglycan carboxypeptidase
MGLGTQFKGEPLPGLRNADGASCQVCDIKQAMTISNNVIFHELALRVGPQKVADAAHRAGILSPLKNVDAGIALGDREVTPVDMASAYATIAAGGVYHAPHLVTKVTTSDDRVLYEAVSPEDRRFSTQVARNVTEAMLGVPTYDKLTLPGGDSVAAKTGTVQSHIENENNDAWTAGFTPNISTAVWIGTDQNTPIKTAQGKPIYGAMLPGNIWKSYMDDAVEAPSSGSSASSDSRHTFGPYKPIGAPPAQTGPYDGFAAKSPKEEQSSQSPSASSSATPSPSEDRKPPKDSTRGGTHQECGLLGCTTVRDNNGGNPRTNDGDTDEDTDSGDRNDAAAEPDGAGTPAPRPARN